MEWPGGRGTEWSIDDAKWAPGWTTVGTTGWVRGSVILLLIYYLLYLSVCVNFSRVKKKKSIGTSRRAATDSPRKSRHMVGEPGKTVTFQIRQIFHL